MQSYTEQAIIYITSALVLVPIFQKLRLGSVLGYLVAGMVIGPFGLNLIHESETVLHFSELGVVFLLFIIGLEIHPRKLWTMRRHLFVLGGIQILFSAVVFALIARFFDLSWAGSLVVGFALSLSSTAFAVQYLSEKNVLNTEYGRSSFSVLLMQDLAAIPALAIIPVILATTQSQQNFNWVSNVKIILIFVLLAASRFLIRPLFRVIAEARSREIFTAVALLIVLGVATLMQYVGLSAALGSFIAGVLLADSEYRHELESNIQPFKGLLMGLFFIAVGMGVNLNLILNDPLIVLAITAGYIAIKAFLIYVAGRIFKLDSENAKLMSLTIAQGGEFAFVIFGIINQLNGVNNDVIALLTVVVTLSMAITPLLNILDEYLTSLRAVDTDKPQYDEIKDESPEVIIVGFGRFGQIFGRILRAQGIPFVAIDHDANQIELIRKFGNKVYYGDATREDILEAAGAKKAKYFVLCIAKPEISVQIVKTLQEKFPHLKIYARARNRSHVFDLMSLGVENLKIKREVLDSSINFVGDLLVDMGFGADTSKNIIEKFKIHDDIMLHQQFEVRQDDKMFVSVSHQGAAQLAQVLSHEGIQSQIAVDGSGKNQ